MKKIFIVFLMLFVVMFAFGQEPSRTVAELDGHDWETMGEIGQTVFVSGFLTSSAVIAGFTGIFEEKQVIDKKTAKYYYELTTTDKKIGEIVVEVSNLYNSTQSYEAPIWVMIYKAIGFQDNSPLLNLLE